MLSTIFTPGLRIRLSPIFFGALLVFAGSLPVLAGDEPLESAAADPTPSPEAIPEAQGPQPAGPQPGDMLLVATPEGATACQQEVTPLFAQDGGSQNQASLPDNWNPALCWRCSGACTSDDICMGMNAGDRCSNNGKTCVAFSGCALFNCCRCQ